MSLVVLTKYKLNLKSQYKVATPKKDNSVLGCCVLDKQVRFWLVRNNRLLSQVRILSEGSPIVRYK